MVEARTDTRQGGKTDVAPSITLLRHISGIDEIHIIGASHGLAGLPHDVLRCHAAGNTPKYKVTRERGRARRLAISSMWLWLWKLNTSTLAISGLSLGNTLMYAGHWPTFARFTRMVRASGRTLCTPADAQRYMPQSQIRRPVPPEDPSSCLKVDNYRRESKPDGRREA